MMRLFTISLVLLVVNGCGLFAPEPTAVEVSGRVVAEGTGEPIGGVSVVLYRQSSIPVPRAETRTGSGGRFALAHDDGEYPSFFVVGINRVPYNAQYSNRIFSVARGETLDLGDIPLTVRRELGVE